MVKRFRLNEFDQDTREVLAEAQQLAQRAGQTHVDVVHVIRCAIADRTFAMALRAVGVDVEALREELDELIGAGATPTYVSAGLQEVLNRAQASAGGDVVALREVIACICEESGDVPELLAKHHIEPDTLRRAPSTVPFEDRLTDTGAEAIERARELARKHGHDQVDSSHLMVAVLEMIAKAPVKAELPEGLDDLKDAIERRLRDRPAPLLPGFTPECCDALARISTDKIGVLSLMSAVDFVVEG